MEKKGGGLRLHLSAGWMTLEAQYSPKAGIFGLMEKHIDNVEK